MAVELATAYVSLVPSARGMRDRIARELDIDTPAEKSGRSAGRRLAGALGSALKKTAIGVGVTAGAALSASLVKGFGRLTAIEEAQAKLAGLGHSAESVRIIMDNALASVKGTAFGLDEAATVAASAVAAGIRPGAELERVLKAVADTSSIAGASMGEMGAIFNKVAASNRLTMAEVNQLANRGIPILQMLADQMGVTAAEASRMVSSGKVDFATFRQALEENVGGAALESGNTTRGAFANMGAAASRFGAALLEGLFPIAKDVFGGITGFLDTATEKIKPWADIFSGWVLTKVVPAAEELLAKIGELGDRIREFFESDVGQQLKTDTLEKLGSIFESLKSAGEQLLPIVLDIISSLGEAAAAIGISTWELLLDTVDILAGVLNDVFVPALRAVANWMKEHQTAVNVLVGAYVSYRLAVVGTTAATAALTAAQKVQAAGGLVAYLKNLLVQTRLVSTATKIWTGIQWLFNAAMAANPVTLIVVGIMLLVGAVILAYKKSETFRNIVQAAFKAVGDAAKWLWENAIKPAWEGIKNAFDVVAGVVSWWWDEVIKPTFDRVKEIAQEVWERIQEYFAKWQGVLDDVREWVTGAKDWVVEKFEEVVGFVRGLPDKIREAASGMWDGIKDAFRNAINWIIDKWNNLSFTLPEMDIPGLGKIGGFTLRPPQIPRLAQGGIVPATPGGRIVRVAEAGQAEAIIPLDRLERMVGGGPEVLELHLDLGEGIREVVRINLREHDRQIARRVMARAGAVR